MGRREAGRRDGEVLSDDRQDGSVAEGGIGKPSTLRYIGRA